MPGVSSEKVPQPRTKNKKKKKKKKKKNKTPDALDFLPCFQHYENMPIQIYWKFHHQKMKIFG